MKKEECRMQKAEGKCRSGSAQASDGYAIPLDALPEEFRGNTGARNGHLLSHARA